VNCGAAGSWFRVPGSGFLVPGSAGSGFGVPDTRFLVPGSGFLVRRVQGSEFRNEEPEPGTAGTGTRNLGTGTAGTGTRNLGTRNQEPGTWNLRFPSSPEMFADPHVCGLRGLHQLRRLRRLHRLGHVAAPVLTFAHEFTGRGAWRSRVHRGRREPSILLLLLAGVAVFAFVKVMSAASRRRSLAEKIFFGALLIVLGAVVVSFRRSSARYR